MDPTVVSKAVEQEWSGETRHRDSEEAESLWGDDFSVFWWGAGRMNLTWMYEMGLTAFLHKREGNNEISLVYRWKWFARKGKAGESELLKNNSCQTQNQVRSVRDEAQPHTYLRS